ncbi:MAG: RsmD family RNA methyltransferase [Chloroflexi bacterium]|nr:RsmD family RNA methyltransferase [Chloroflexota bacterium]
MDVEFLGDTPPATASRSTDAEACVDPKPYRRGEKHPLNRLNELSGEEWLYFTRTVLTTAYPRELGHDVRKAHGANKPPRLMKLLIEFFTAAGGRVLDPFAGVGGTLIGAAISDPPRYCLGIELNPRWAEIYHQVIEEGAGIIPACPMTVGDCREEMRRLEDDSFDLIATDPPYNVQLERTMCNGRYPGHRNRQTDYNMVSASDLDLANAGGYEQYLDSMEEVFSECRRVLKANRYMVVIVRNCYQNGEYVYVNADLSRRAKRAGFVPKGEKIWYQAGTRLRPYGYPHSYVPNISHQHIIILQKPRQAMA